MTFKRPPGILFRDMEIATPNSSYYHETNNPKPLKGMLDYLSELYFYY